MLLPGRPYPGHMIDTRQSPGERQRIIISLFFLRLHLVVNNATPIDHVTGLVNNIWMNFLFPLK